MNIFSTVLWGKVQKSKKSSETDCPRNHGAAQDPEQQKISESEAKVVGGKRIGGSS